MCFAAAPRRCPTSTSSRCLASARPALAPKCEFISVRALKAAYRNQIYLLPARVIPSGSVAFPQSDRLRSADGAKDFAAGRGAGESGPIYNDAFDTGGVRSKPKIDAGVVSTQVAAVGVGTTPDGGLSSTKEADPRAEDVLLSVA